MVRKTTSIMLFGKKITIETDTNMSSGEETVKKTYVEDLESQGNFIDKNRGETSTEKKQRNGITRYYWINPILEFPSEIKNAIDSSSGRDLVFMMGMKYEQSDVQINLKPFYILESERLMNYLTKDEKRKIEEESGLDVLGFGPKANTFNLKLKLWPSDGDFKLVTEKKWGKLVSDNGPVIEVWCFRVGSVLWVALNSENKAVFDPQSGAGGGGVRIGGGSVSENYEGEGGKRFIKQQKPMFKCRAQSIVSGRKIKKPQETQPPMKLPFKMIEAIKSAGGTDLIFLMEKKLKETDINKYQNRIIVSNQEILMEYLTEYEKQSIETKGRNGGLDVVVIDPRAKCYGMKLKWWPSSNQYALIKDWWKLVRDNGLLKDDMVEIWCFRVDLRLNLVVNAVSKVVGFN